MTILQRLCSPSVKVVALIMLFSSAHYFASPESDIFKEMQDRLEKQTIIKHNDTTSQTIKFLSYNIQLSGLDNQSHVWKDRQNAVYALINYVDIVALQEVSHEQFMDLKKALPEFTFVGINTVTGKDLVDDSNVTQEGLTVGFRNDIFTLKSDTMTWYSETPEAPSQKWGNWSGAFPKALQRVTLTFNINGQEVDIFNSHFAHDENAAGINPRVLSSNMELGLLSNEGDRYWISAGDRNFHFPRDLEAYELYKKNKLVADSKETALQTWGQTTFIGYEDHSRINPVNQDGIFEKKYYLDVLFHNQKFIKSNWWYSHLGEYDDKLNLLPIGNYKQLAKRLFASDHTAVFVQYELQDFYK